jgi:hypothetical protein
MDAAVTTTRSRQSRMKAVAAARATVGRSRRQRANEGWGAATEEERRAAVGRDESLGVWTSIEWAETPSAGGALTARLRESVSGLDL